MNAETVPGAARRAKKRDNAETLGRLQKTLGRFWTSLDMWLDSTAGQLLLIAVALTGLLFAFTIGP